MTLLLGLVIGAVVLLFLLFKTGVIRGDIERSPAEVAQYVEDFVAQTGGDWDWDDFTSIKIRDPELDKLRIRCGVIQDNHPPENESEWCSEAGREALMKLVVDLDLDAA